MTMPGRLVQVVSQLASSPPGSDQCREVRPRASGPYWEEKLKTARVRASARSGQQVAPVADHDQGPDGRQDQRVQDADGVVVGDQLDQVLAVEGGQGDAARGQGHRQRAKAPGQP
jgi:hypothetical protein